MKRLFGKNFTLLFLAIFSPFSIDLMGQCDSIEDVNFTIDNPVNCGAPSTVTFLSNISLDTTPILLETVIAPNNFQQAFDFEFFTQNNSCSYFIEVSGAFTKWGNNEYIDALAKFDINTNGLIEMGGLMEDIDPSAQQIIPNNYNPNHIYRYYYPGDGGSVSYEFSDSPYNDNEGDVTFAWYVVPCFSYSWDFGDGATSDELNPIHIYDNTGTYTAVLTVTDIFNNCSESFSLDVVVGEVPTFEISLIEPCINNNDGEIMIATTSGKEPFQFSLNGNGFQNENIFTGLTDGIYEVIIRDDNGCTNSTNVQLNALPLPIIDDLLVTNTDCNQANGGITVITTSSDGAILYSLNGNDYQVENIFSNLAIGDYTVFIQNENGCINSETATVINAEELLVKNVVTTDETCDAANGSISLEITGGVGEKTILLNNSIAQLETTFANLKAGEYTLLVTDENGCTVETAATIANKECSTYIPNAFSPNNDGINDVFRIFPSSNFSGTFKSFLVFDRWGGNVYESFDIDVSANNWWDGTHNGKILDTGIYTYFIEVEYDNGETEMIKGDVFLTK